MSRRDLPPVVLLLAFLIAAVRSIATHPPMHCSFLCKRRYDSGMIACRESFPSYLSHAVYHTFPVQPGGASLNTNRFGALESSKDIECPQKIFEDHPLRLEGN